MEDGHFSGRPPLHVRICHLLWHCFLKLLFILHFYFSHEIVQTADCSEDIPSDTYRTQVSTQKNGSKESFTVTIDVREAEGAQLLMSCAKNHDIERRRAVVKLPRAREKEREEDTVCSVVHIIVSRDVISEIHTRDTQVSYVTLIPSEVSKPGPNSKLVSFEICPNRFYIADGFPTEC